MYVCVCTYIHRQFCLQCLNLLDVLFSILDWGSFIVCGALFRSTRFRWFSGVGRVESFGLVRLSLGFEGFRTLQVAVIFMERVVVLSALRARGSPYCLEFRALGCRGLRLRALGCRAAFYLLGREDPDSAGSWSLPG